MKKEKTWIVFGPGDMHTYFKGALLYFWILSLSAETCPYPCNCNKDSSTVTCLDSQDVALPLEVSPLSHTLILQGVSILTLPEAAFSGNGTDLELKTLHLSWNNIHTIKAHAFRTLPRLQLLDISHNELESLSVLAFDGLEELRFLSLNNTLTSSGASDLPKALSTTSLRSLQRLELSGNRLKTMPISHFDNLNLNTLLLTNNSIEVIGKNNVTSFYNFKNIRVYLSKNPFKCNCELEAFYYWLKNDSQCADSSRLLCAHPEAKRGEAVEKLRREDVGCINAELEAVSYVLLGIVLALIGVVFLMVMYLNRGGIKRWLNNIREACRDQMEVYHYRYEQDSDPRLANVAV